MPRYFVYLVVALLSTTLATSVLLSQDYSPTKDFPPDGDLNDWGRTNQQYDPSYSHLYDNEAQYLDNAVSFEAGKVPPGGDPNAPGGGEFHL